MSERPYFKVWAEKLLVSHDLGNLSDHERTVWLYLMGTASIAAPRWTVRVTRNLAHVCHTTEPKLAAALSTMADFGMVELRDGNVTIINGPKHNEMTEKRPKPSDAPEKVRERVTRFRGVTRSDETPNVTREKRPPLFEEGRGKREELDPSPSVPSGEGTAPPSETLGIMLLAQPKATRDASLWDECSFLAANHTYAEIEAAINRQRSTKDEAGRPLQPYPSVWRRFLEEPKEPPPQPPKRPLPYDPEMSHAKLMAGRRSP